MNNVGKNIKRQRLDKGMSQNDLARKLYVSRQTVSNYENGKSYPDVDMIVKIGEIFGTDANGIIHGVKNTENRKQRILTVLLAGAILVGYSIVWPWSSNGPDSSYDMGGGYRICNSFGTYIILDGRPVVPVGVSAVTANKDYIVAQHNENEETSYWVITRSTEEVAGPLSRNEYLAMAISSGSIDTDSF